MALVGAAGHKGLVLWSTEEKKALKVSFDDDVTSMKFVGDKVVCGSLNLRVYDAFTGEQAGRWAAHTKPITSMFTGPDGVYTTSEDGKIGMWDIRQKKCARMIDTQCSGVYSGTVYEGTLYYTDYYGHVYKADTSARKQISNCTISLASAPDGVGVYGYDKRGRLYRIETDLNTDVGCSINKIGEYGIRAQIGFGYISVASSEGIGLVRIPRRSEGCSQGGHAPEYVKVAFYETPRWVWDAEFDPTPAPLHHSPAGGHMPSPPGTLYFVSSDGTLRTINPKEKGTRTIFSVDYPLKCVSTQVPGGS